MNTNNLMNWYLDLVLSIMYFHLFLFLYGNCHSHWLHDNHYFENLSVSSLLCCLNMPEIINCIISNWQENSLDIRFYELGTLPWYRNLRRALGMRACRHSRSTASTSGNHNRSLLRWSSWRELRWTGPSEGGFNW